MPAQATLIVLRSGWWSCHRWASQAQSLSHQYSTHGSSHCHNAIATPTTIQMTLSIQMTPSLLLPASVKCTEIRKGRVSNRDFCNLFLMKNQNIVNNTFSSTVYVLLAKQVYVPIQAVSFQSRRLTVLINCCPVTCDRCFITRALLCLDNDNDE